ncbi:hypothetical protein [Scytonema sp. PRP1]
MSVPHSGGAYPNGEGECVRSGLSRAAPRGTQRGLELTLLSRHAECSIVA